MDDRNDEGSDPVSRVLASIGGRSPLLLAVSGGLDSMVLLHSATVALDRSCIAVATYDHGTGPHAQRAARLVKARCRQLRVECTAGRSSTAGKRESEWRDARWRFLRATADRSGATVVTAHTLDDQIETVFIRILRDAGARGLAGLFAASDVLRPFLTLGRSDIARYAIEERVVFVDDPSNDSRRHLRNRVRHDLLPAIVGVRPHFPADLLDISREAARWRNAMAVLADGTDAEARSDGSLRIARSAVAGYDAEGLRVLWPALAAKVNVVVDRRGTHRLAEFTMRGHTGGSIQLSGGIEVRMFRDHLILGRWDSRRVEALRIARARRRGVRPNPLQGGH